MPNNIKSKPFISVKDEVRDKRSKLYDMAEFEGPYKLSFLDHDFMLRDELRPVRLQLELLRPELIQQEQNINETIVVFGSARIADKASAEKKLKAIDNKLAKDPHNPDLLNHKRYTQSLLDKYYFYEESEKFGEIVTKACKKISNYNFVIITGGGPGIMEAANKGAFEAGGKSVAVSIALPMEEKPNPYVTPELTFKFHYFAIRKMHFLLRARALVAFPGGFGTLDELFETLTLMQTQKIRQVPVILVGKEYWHKIINFQALVEEGVVAPGDLDLLTFVDNAEQAWNVIAEFYNIPV